MQNVSHFIWTHSILQRFPNILQLIERFYNRKCLPVLFWNKHLRMQSSPYSMCEGETGSQTHKVRQSSGSVNTILAHNNITILGCGRHPRPCKKIGAKLMMSEVAQVSAACQYLTAVVTWEKKKIYILKFVECNLPHNTPGCRVGGENRSEVPMKSVSSTFECWAVRWKHFNYPKKFFPNQYIITI